MLSGLFGPVSLDRFAQGLPDREDTPVVDECVFCGEEIYDGEHGIKRIEAGLIHDSFEKRCLEEYAEAMHVPVDDLNAIDVIPGHEPPPGGYEWD